MKYEDLEIGKLYKLEFSFNNYVSTAIIKFTKLNNNSYEYQTILSDHNTKYPFSFFELGTKVRKIDLMYIKEYPERSWMTHLKPLE